MFELFSFLIAAEKKEKGQDLAEYALLLGLIALIVILAVTLLGTEISVIFSNIANNFASYDIAGGS